MLNEEQISEWQQLVDDATPGPWHSNTVDENTTSVCVICNNGWGRKLLTIDRSGSDERRMEANNNARFIANSRTIIPELIEEIKRLNDEANWLAKELTKYKPCAFTDESKSCGGNCVICWREISSKSSKPELRESGKGEVK